MKNRNLVLIIKDGDVYADSWDIGIFSYDIIEHWWDTDEFSCALDAAQMPSEVWEMSEVSMYQIDCCARICFDSVIDEFDQTFDEPYLEILEYDSRKVTEDYPVDSIIMPKEQIYNEQIFPLVDQIINICKKYRIATLMNFHIPDNKRPNLQVLSSLLSDEYFDEFGGHEAIDRMRRSLEILMKDRIKGK